MNKNTKRNIKLRLNYEQIERINSLDNFSFETGDGYIFNNEEKEKDDNINSNIELKQL